MLSPLPTLQGTRLQKCVLSPPCGQCPPGREATPPPPAGPWRTWDETQMQGKGMKALAGPVPHAVPHGRIASAECPHSAVTSRHACRLRSQGLSEPVSDQRIRNETLTPILTC